MPRRSIYQQREHPITSAAFSLLRKCPFLYLYFPYLRLSIFTISALSSLWACVCLAISLHVNSACYGHEVRPFCLDSRDRDSTVDRNLYIKTLKALCMSACLPVRPNCVAACLAAWLCLVLSKDASFTSHMQISYTVVNVNVR